MPRTNRLLISQHQGCYHIISRTTRRKVMFDYLEKEYLLTLLTVFASGFFIKVHGFCIMGNHFHILASGMEEEASEASKEELLRRYQLMYGAKAKPPAGSTKSYGCFQVDEDGGIERLRLRLGSISRFVQEFKQHFSVWYNKRHGLQGYLWHDRFKSIIFERGMPQLYCSMYIDANPVRAGLVKNPEHYRWSSLGLRVGDAELADELLSPVEEDLDCYRKLLCSYRGEEKEGPEKRAAKGRDQGLKKVGQLVNVEMIRCRVKNFSQGVAVGGDTFIAEIQKRTHRKFIRPRPIMKSMGLYTTRVLH